MSGVTAEIEGQRELPLDVVEAVAKALGGLTEQEIVIAEGRRRPVFWRCC